MSPNGSLIPVRIRITPTFKNGEQIGYYGVTEVLEDIPIAQVAPPISMFTKIFRWVLVTRAPFLSAVIMPILIGTAWVAYQGIASPFPTVKFWLALFAGICLHISANVFNDYFDGCSGTDQANNNYFLPYSGGSRSVELGLADEKTLFRVASGALAISIVIGLYLAFTSGSGVIAFGLARAFLAYFYTAPPLRLAAWKGFGELSIGLTFGPLATAGTVYALTGQAPLYSFLIGIPIGLLTVMILWINQFPDEEADKATGKHNLVVILGKENARWGYLLLLTAFVMMIYLVLTGIFPPLALITLLLAPFAVFVCLVVFRNFAQRSLIRANLATIQLHALAGLLRVEGVKPRIFRPGI